MGLKERVKKLQKRLPATEKLEGLVWHDEEGEIIYELSFEPSPDGGPPIMKDWWSGWPEPRPVGQFEPATDA